MLFPGQAMEAPAVQARALVVVVFVPFKSFEYIDCRLEPMFGRQRGSVMRARTTSANEQHRLVRFHPGSYLSDEVGIANTVGVIVPFHME